MFSQTHNLQASQICALTIFPSTVMDRVSNSTPIVDFESRSNLFRAKRENTGSPASSIGGWKGSCGQPLHTIAIEQSVSHHEGAEKWTYTRFAATRVSNQNHLKGVDLCYWSEQGQGAHPEEMIVEPWLGHCLSISFPKKSERATNWSGSGRGCEHTNSAAQTQRDMRNQKRAERRMNSWDGLACFALIPQTMHTCGSPISLADSGWAPANDCRKRRKGHHAK